MSMQAYASRTGWIMLAAIVMFSVGFFRIISGISYLANSHRINNLSFGILGDNMWLWGIWDLGIAALSYIWAIMVIVNGFLIIGYAPWFAAGMITLAVLVVYGLASTPLERSESRSESGGMG